MCSKQNSVIRRKEWSESYGKRKEDIVAAEKDIFVWMQMDDALGRALVYITGNVE